MADTSRIDDLRRRVQKDPASIAFAQLAEECRRAGRFEESVEVCRAGLNIHPGYLSARVTLGRALIELDALDAGLTELELVLKSAPENLAALRGLAEIHHRRGSLVEALVHYRAALTLAKNDPDLQRTVADLEAMVEPPKPAAVDDGMNFAEAEAELLKNLELPPPPPRPVPAARPLAALESIAPGPVLAPQQPDFQLASVSSELAPEPVVELDLPSLEAQQTIEPPVEIDLPEKTPPPVEPLVEVDLPSLEAARVPEPEVANDLTASPLPIEESSREFGIEAVALEKVLEPVVGFDLVAPPPLAPEPAIEVDLGARVVPFGLPPGAASHAARSAAAVEERLPVESPEAAAERDRAARAIVALEQWLDAIHAIRTQRCA